jgi:hypothetical protein
MNPASDFAQPYPDLGLYQDFLHSRPETYGSQNSENYTTCCYVLVPCLLGHCAKEDQVLGVPGDHREGEQRGGRSLLGTQLLVFGFEIILVWFRFFYKTGFFLKRKRSLSFSWLVFSISCRSLLLRGY